MKEFIENTNNSAAYRNSLLSCSTLTGSMQVRALSRSSYTCENCGKQFETGYGKKNRFCSRSCCASFNAKKAPITKERLEQLVRARSAIKYNHNCTCSICGKLFEKQASLMNHVRWIHKEGKEEDHIGVVKVNTDKDKKERTCSFCGKTWNCFIWHFHKHEAECKQNPNRRIVKGHPQSEETRKKLSEAGLKNDYRRLMRKTQLYNGVLYDSSWEVELAKRLENLNEVFERPKNPIKYVGSDGKEHNYFPDFYLPNRRVFLEVKNPYLFENDSKVQILRATRGDIIWLTSLEQIQNFK